MEKSFSNSVDFREGSDGKSNSVAKQVISDENGGSAVQSIISFSQLIFVFKFLFTVYFYLKTSCLLLLCI